jgi:putative FmdB family regulatory protein
MPTYEFRCSDCGNLFETFQRVDDEPPTVCERCGGRLRKVFHPAGIVFKGSGFYATDSRKKAKAGSNESADSKAEKSEKKETKDTKAAEKSGTKKPAGTEPSS